MEGEVWVLRFVNPENYSRFVVVYLVSSFLHNTKFNFEMKKILLALSFILAIKGVNAQLPTECVPKKQNVMFIKQKKMIAILVEEDEEYIAELKKSGKNEDVLKKYLESLKNYNDNLKELLPKYFTFPKAVEFKTYSEVIAMPIAKRGTYTFLVYNLSESTGLVKVQESGTGKESETAGLVTCTLNFFDVKNDKGNLAIYKGQTHFEEVDLYAKLEIYTKVTPKSEDNDANMIYFRSIPALNPSKGDLAYCFMQTQKTLEEAMLPPAKPSKNEDENAKVLKTKTLLIRKENLDKGVTEEGIKGVYKNDFKLVDKAEFDQAILTKDPKYCYLMVVPLYSMPMPIGGAISKTNISCGQILIDAATNKTAAISFAKVMFAGMGAQVCNEVKLKHLEKYQKASE